jgi:hypothetical protein
MGNNPSISLDTQTAYERQICSMVNEVIKSWKNEIHTYNDLIITPFKIGVPKQSIILPKFLYVHLVNMAMHEVTEYELTYIESIYKLANSNMDCTGAVEVIKFQDGLFINFRKDIKTHRMDTKVKEVQENFIEPFMSKVQSLEKT